MTDRDFLVEKNHFLLKNLRIHEETDVFKG